VIGAAVGSFLNVVVYRLPLGISIVSPPSHCPKCRKPIAFYDNVPILGWLWLRGRCRQCHHPISTRYPTVETITAVMFALLAVIELSSRGVNLPRRHFGSGAVLFSQWSMNQVYATYLYQILLSCTLWCATLIDYDGQRVPVKLFWPAIVIGLGAPLIWPWLHPMAAWGPTESSIAGAIDGLTGATAGAVVGAVAWRLTKPITSDVRKKKKAAKAPPPTRSMSALYAPICVGLFLGWQAIAVIAAATAIVQLLTWLAKRVFSRLPGATLGSFNGSLMVFAIGWIAFWERLASICR
jgi:prepilin signal peptidase PulO-like enzyme (type II secretory pathway)